MNYRRLGKTGLKVSELSYGSWVTFSFQIGQKKVTQMLKLAYDNGVNFFTISCLSENSSDSKLSLINL